MFPEQQPARPSIQRTGTRTTQKRYLGNTSYSTQPWHFIRRDSRRTIPSEPEISHSVFLKMAVLSALYRTCSRGGFHSDWSAESPSELLHQAGSPSELRTSQHRRLSTLARFFSIFNIKTMKHKPIAPRGTATREQGAFSARHQRTATQDQTIMELNEKKKSWIRERRKTGGELLAVHQTEGQKQAEKLQKKKKWLHCTSQCPKSRNKSKNKVQCEKFVISTWVQRKTVPTLSPKGGLSRGWDISTGSNEMRAHVHLLSSTVRTTSSSTPPWVNVHLQH